jgi:hypothetical protein
MVDAGLFLLIQEFSFTMHSTTHENINQSQGDDSNTELETTRANLIQLLNQVAKEVARRIVSKNQPGHTIRDSSLR